MGGPGEVVPIVPAAVLFDLGRGGVFSNHPGVAEGRAACEVAHAGPGAQGGVGAGTGAKAGGLKGAIGSASAVLEDGTTVGVLVAVNAVGAPYDPATGELLALRHGIGDEFAGIGRPDEDDCEQARQAAAAAYGGAPMRPEWPPRSASSPRMRLSARRSARRSAASPRRLARAINPVHTPSSTGNTLFTVATGERPAPDLAGLYALMAAAGDCVTRAVGHAMLAATSATTADGPLRSWRDAFPSAVRMDR